MLIRECNCTCKFCYKFKGETEPLVLGGGRGGGGEWEHAGTNADKPLTLLSLSCILGLSIVKWLWNSARIL